ncbi:NADPH-dependent FMN reductase [Citrifermentans bremense]|uniref:NADPH-dependent FMN reductase n=1 Tax=Citrifermentans bremense TaxID=60035 RepID=A0A6S6M5F7_9BACT|nr:flavodoxin family protein [Citrifermentans bremense]BCG48913.1 NADPH-dependent FMN reductase [Citrifermentans bremense]
MKILAINGSPRGMNGTTGRLLEEVMAGAVQAGADIEIVTLAQTPIKPCVACDVCHKVGTCPVKDEFEEIKQKLVAADAFILATPNYLLSITAQLKAFLDRCNGLIHLTSLEGKYAALVETSGGGGDEEVLEYMQRIVNAMGAQNVGSIGSPGAGHRVFPDQDALFQKARALGKDLCDSVREKRQFPEQDEWRLGFKARMEQLIGYVGEAWPYEHQIVAKR